MIREILAIGAVSALLLPGASPAVEQESSRHLMLAAENSRPKEASAEKKRKKREEDARRHYLGDKHQAEKRAAKGPSSPSSARETKGKAADANYSQ